jgi:CheY-like chemotaxis protein
MGTQVNILLVEDDEVDVMNVKRAFTKNNITNPLFVAGDGLEALEMLRSNDVDRAARFEHAADERDRVPARDP